MHVVHMAPNFRNGIIRIGKDTKDYADCHNNQAKTKDRINLANDLINRDKRCNKVVNQNDNQPEQCCGNDTGQPAVFTQRNNQTGRTYGKYRADHNQQNNGEYAHNVLHTGTQILTSHFSDGTAVVSLTDHT